MPDACHRWDPPANQRSGVLGCFHVHRLAVSATRRVRYVNGRTPLALQPWTTCCAAALGPLGLVRRTSLLDREETFSSFGSGRSTTVSITTHVLELQTHCRSPAATVKRRTRRKMPTVR